MTVALEESVEIQTQTDLEQSITTLYDIGNIGDYLNMFGSDLIKRLNAEYVPVHHPGEDQALDVLTEIKRPLFQAQGHVTTVLSKGYARHRRLILVGGMGTGKTAVSISLFYVLLKQLVGGVGRVLYMVPNHLIEKTKREIGELIDTAKFEVSFIKDYLDVIHLRNSGKFQSKPQKMEIYIIARDTAKLGYVYEPIAKWVDRTYIKKSRDGSTHRKTAFQGWKCPECGGQLMKEKDGESIPMEYDDFFDKHGKSKRRKRNQKCGVLVRKYKHSDPDKDEYQICGAPLWQAKNKNKVNFKGEPQKVDGTAARKVSPADLFKRYFKKSFDLVVGDEVHELTGGSAQAHAFHVFMGCAKYTLAMTGTLMNGYASNLFELIFRLNPRRMKEMGFEWGDIGRWIDLYGVREKVTKDSKDDSLNSSSNGSSRKVNTKEMPAAAPQLFTDMLSDIACFIQMSDMFEVLPELQEGPINTPLEGKRRFVNCSSRITRKHGRAKRQLHSRMRLMAPSWYLQRNFEEVERLLRRAVEKELSNGGNTALLGSLLSTTLSYPDVPFNFDGVYHPDSGKCVVPPSYRLSDKLLYPKELELIKFVKSQIKLGRKVGVYATFTGKLGTLQRLQMLLEENGIKTAVLESSVAGPKREAWIQEREKEGVQVLLTNPILVSTGLDLLGFPSLYFYQTGYRLSIVRQASRRHWRIGQQNKCLTVYSSYKNTMQELAVNLMATKMSASLALEGQFSQEGLAALTEGSGGSLANELAKRFIGNQIDGVESAESIWGKMSIDATQFITKPAIEVVEPEEELILASEPEPQILEYMGESMSDALLKWVDNNVPIDLKARFEKQMDYAVRNIQGGYNGLSFDTTSIFEVLLKIDPDHIPTEEVEYRRWLFGMTNMPSVPETPVETSEFKLELVTESKTVKVKTKKVYNVAEGQFAFNF